MKKAIIIILIGGFIIGGILFFVQLRNNSTKDVDKNRQEEFFDNYNDISKEKDKDKRFIDNKNNKISFNYKKAHAINKETVGAIYIPKTSIMFPIVKHKDNNYYLNHTFYNNYAIRGAIFMDFNQTFEDKHTMIYGHNLVSGDMFSELTKYIDANFARGHNIAYIWNKDKKGKYRIFSSFVTSRTDYETYKLGYPNTNSYERWLNKIKKRSAVSYKLQPNKNKNTITLSTCTDNTHRQTIHLQKVK